MPIHNRHLRLPNWAMTGSKLTKTKTGIFGYRKRVPKALQSIVGKSEIIRTLGTKNPDEAKVRLKEIDAVVDRQFREASKTGKLPVADSQSIAPQDIHKQALAWLRSKGFEYKPYEQFDRYENELDGREAVVDQLLAEHGHYGGLAAYEEEVLEYERGDPLLLEKIAVALAGPKVSSTGKPPITLRQALREYLRINQRDNDTLATKIKFGRERMNVVNFAIGIIGDIDITAITRAQARQIVEAYQQQELSPSSVNKYIGILSTIINFSYLENDIEKSNPFRELSVPTPPAKEARDAMSIDQAKAFLNALNESNEELQSIGKLLFLTGARLNEIAGLCIEDISFAEPASIRIANNAIRRVKTDASIRSVPLVGIGKQIVEAAKGDRTEGALFPRYGKDGGSSTASAALVKVLREKAAITDKKIVPYSSRHTVKDLLRIAAVPKEITDMIQGHSTGDAASAYGSSELLEQKAEALLKALKPLEKELLLPT